MKSSCVHTHTNRAALEYQTRRRLPLGLNTHHTEKNIKLSNPSDVLFTPQTVGSYSNDCE